MAGQGNAKGQARRLPLPYLAALPAMPCPALPYSPARCPAMRCPATNSTTALS